MVQLFNLFFFVFLTFEGLLIVLVLVGVVAWYWRMKSGALYTPLGEQEGTTAELDHFGSDSDSAEVQLSSEDDQNL